MALNDITLRNGYTMPRIGLGTSESPASLMSLTIRDAIDIGYRHIDCAHSHGNEAAIGEVLEELIDKGKVKRHDLFISSKLWNTFHHPDQVKRAIGQSLENLRVSYLDLYLMHWPMGFKKSDELYPKSETNQIIYSDVDFLNTWKAMEKLVQSNLCRGIGLCNFNIKQIRQILYYGKIKPQVLQAECHPYFPQDELIAFCKKNHIVFTAYGSLGATHSPDKKPGEVPLLQHPLILEMADRLDCSISQILLRYQIQRGNAVVPRSIERSHLIKNFRLDDFHLSEDDMAMLQTLNMGEDGRIFRMNECYDHPFYPFGEDKAADAKEDVAVEENEETITSDQISSLWL